MTATALSLLQPALPGSDRLPPWSAAARAVYLPMLSAALAAGDMEQVTEICTSPDIPTRPSSAGLIGPVTTDPLSKEQ